MLNVLEVKPEKPDWWFGRVQRRDSGYGVRMMLRWELAGGGPGRRL